MTHPDIKLLLNVSNVCSPSNSVSPGLHPSRPKKINPHSNLCPAHPSGSGSNAALGKLKEYPHPSQLELTKTIFGLSSSINVNGTCQQMSATSLSHRLTQEVGREEKPKSMKRMVSLLVALSYLSTEDLLIIFDLFVSAFTVIHSGISTF